MFKNLFPKHEKLIFGGDSIVSFKEGFAVKQYSQLPLEHLLDYQHVTNNLYGVWTFEGWSISVNPIISVTQHDGYVETISACLVGETLNTICDKGVKARLGYFLTNDLSLQLNKQHRCSGINIISWNVMCDLPKQSAVITDICSDVSSFKKH